MPIDIPPMIEADPLAGEDQRPGPIGRLVRRLVLPTLGPYFKHQRDIEYALVLRIDELEKKVDTYFDAHVDPFEVEERFEAHDRARVELIQALEQVRAKLDRELRRRSEVFDHADAIADVAEASRALPYMEGQPLAEFENAHVGQVIGYRSGDGAVEWAYREFESVFRGSEERIAEIQRPYLDLLEGRAPVVDIGCGRGEFLDLLRENGIPAIGVDRDAGMVERCREKGHEEVTLGDAVGFLEDRDDDSLAAIFSAQLIEHIPRDELEPFFAVAARKLQPGGLFIAETVNPHCARALKAFWLDLTHQHPIFPEVALMLCRIAGFPEAYVFHPMGSGDAAHDRFTQDAYAVVATKAA
jgi:SAM-dependent methyltransferase